MIQVGGLAIFGEREVVLAADLLEPLLALLFLLIGHEIVPVLLAGDGVQLSVHFSDVLLLLGHLLLPLSAGILPPLQFSVFLSQELDSHVFLNESLLLDLLLQTLRLHCWRLIFLRHGVCDEAQLQLRSLILGHQCCLRAQLLRDRRRL